jgi:hypothetical protein
MTRLGQRSAGLPQAAFGEAGPAVAGGAPKTRLGSRSEPARGELQDLPTVGSAYIQLVGHVVSNQIEAAVFKSMAEVGLEPTLNHAFSYDMNRQARILAHAAREPDDHSKHLGSVEEWLDLDDDVIFACSLRYKDVRNRLDPLGSEAKITEEDHILLRDAFEKKNASLLRSFGIATLTSWLLSGVVQLSSSPTPSSSSGGPLPES